MMNKFLPLWLVLSSIVFLSIALLWCSDNPAPHQDQPTTFTTVSGQGVKPGTPLVFPKDHGIHQQQGIEWWYLTTNLETEAGETYGVQWTLFRTLMPQGVSSAWWDENLYFAHFALQHEQQHVSFERFARFGQANVSSEPFSARIDDWVLASESADFLPLRLTAKQDDYAIDISLTNSVRVLHGDKGFSQKTQSGHASYYYSYPFLEVSGTIQFDGKSQTVKGHAWYDREWSASLLDKDKLGWDWFSVVDDSPSNKQGLMLFCIRKKQQVYDYCSASKITADGSVLTYPSEQISLSVLETIAIDGTVYPKKWQATLPDVSTITIETVTTDSRNQLTIPYWEGRVKVSGGIEGKGYAELVGY